MSTKTITTPIPLIRNLGGQNLFESDDPVFQEYRRRWSNQPLTGETGSFPLFLDIEVTNLCNLRCTFCATTFFGPEVPRGLIDPGLVHEILEEGASNGLCGVKFNDRGEPLLHPNLEEFVAHASSLGLVDIYFNTNAMLLDEKRARRLIEAGLTRISISVEGTSPDPYERLRRGGKFETILQNIRRLYELRQEIGSPTPAIRIQSVLVPEIADNLEHYKHFWGRFSDEVAVLEYKNESCAQSRPRGVASPWCCPQPWQRMTVWFDGTILPCNEDDRGRLSLGKYGSLTLRQAWKHKKIEELRRIHRLGQAHTIEACDGCYLRDSQILKIGIDS